MKNNNENQLHWADEKEVIKTNRPLILLLILMKKLPAAFIFVLIYPISFFYFIFSKRAREEGCNYQKILHLYTGGVSPKKISPFRQILSFTLCVMEKMEGWLGNYNYNKLVVHDDDLKQLQAQLEQGKGAFLICSHLGNMELMRSLSSFGEDGVSRTVGVTAVIETNATEQFNRTLNQINPNVNFQVLDPSAIGPDTMITLQERIENGGLVVITGDRTSSRTRMRVIREKFLGKEADFPYGVFVLGMLLKAPIYYVFGLRTKTATLFPRSNMFVEKSTVNFNCARSERDERIKELCREFVKKLEKYCIKFPYQWYNFYNFWLCNEEIEVDGANA